jgi:hypothetical protein
MDWEVRNLSGQLLQLIEARLPHDRFHHPGQMLDGAPTLPPGGAVSLELPVLCGEPPGTAFENAFLILRAAWRDRPWRVFVRLRVEVGLDGAPRPKVEAVTAQRIGFSQRR